MMPLDDFPPFRPRNVRSPRALTPEESRELQLREVVRANQQFRCKSKSRKRRIAMIAAGALLAIFALPTIERIALDPVDHEDAAVEVALASRA